MDVAKKKGTNGIFQHIKKNKRHNIEWDKVCIIDREKHWESRKIKAAVFINATDPSSQAQKLMNLEKGWELSPIWNMFNSHICKGT